MKGSHLVGIAEGPEGKSVPVLSGATQFLFVDTYGVPYEWLGEILAKHGMCFDWVGFCEAAAKAHWPEERCRDLLVADGCSFEKQPELFGGIILGYRRARKAEAGKGV